MKFGKFLSCRALSLIKDFLSNFLRGAGFLFASLFFAIFLFLFLMQAYGVLMDFTGAGDGFNPYIFAAWCMLSLFATGLCFVFSIPVFRKLSAFMLGKKNFGKKTEDGAEEGDIQC